MNVFAALEASRGLAFALAFGSLKAGKKSIDEKRTYFNLRAYILTINTINKRIIKADTQITKAY